MRLCFVVISCQCNPLRFYCVPSFPAQTLYKTENCRSYIPKRICSCSLLIERFGYLREEGQDEDGNRAPEGQILGLVVAV